MKSKVTEQNRPELLTFAAAPRFIALSINHGRGSLQKKITTCYFEWMNQEPTNTCFTLKWNIIERSYATLLQVTIYKKLQVF